MHARVPSTFLPEHLRTLVRIDTLNANAEHHLSGLTFPVCMLAQFGISCMHSLPSTVGIDIQRYVGMALKSMF